MPGGDAHINGAEYADQRLEEFLLSKGSLSSVLMSIVERPFFGLVGVFEVQGNRSWTLFAAYLFKVAQPKRGKSVLISYLIRSMSFLLTSGGSLVRISASIFTSLSYPMCSPSFWIAVMNFSPSSTNILISLS